MRALTTRPSVVLSAAAEATTLLLLRRALRHLSTTAKRNKLQLRMLKNRFSGETGPLDELVFDRKTGRLTVPMSSYFGL